MKRYRKVFEPEAIQITRDNLDQIEKMIQDSGEYWSILKGDPIWIYNQGYEESYPDHQEGDWVVKGINECIYLVSDEVFKKTYQEVDGSSWIPMHPLHPGAIIQPGSCICLTKAGYAISCARQDHMSEDCIGIAGKTHGPMIEVLRKTDEEVTE